METFADLLRNWTTAQLAADLGVRHSTAQSMVRRGSVSPRHWRKLLIAARAQGLDLDASALLKLWHASKQARTQHGRYPAPIKYPEGIYGDVREL